MSKRIASLEPEDNEEELVQSEDDDAQNSRYSRFSTKRRKLSHSEEDPSEDEDNADHGGRLEPPGEEAEDVHEQAEEGGTKVISSKPISSKSSTLKVLTPAQLEKAQLKARKTGVIYLSRIPPFMKPATLRQLLSPYGTILRMFLTPEAPARYQARIKSGGNKKRSFVDGWVEFESKKKAKICAETLNGNIIGGKKGGWYHDDIWNIKYLRGFKWNDLMEQVQSEEREREGRLRAEIQKETRERKAFLDNVERAKVERGMEAKRAKKSGPVGKDSDDAQVVASMNDTSRPPAPNAVNKRSKMKFRQNAVRAGDDPGRVAKKPAGGAGALSKVF